MGILRWYREQGIKNPLRRLTYTSVTIFALVPCLLLLLLFLNSASQGFQYNNIYFFGVRPTLIITDSMEPTIMTNAIVIVEDIEFDDVEVGDIVRYNSPQMGYSIVHRVVSRSETQLFTKGDNNPTIDKWPVDETMLNGKVTQINNDVAEVLSFIFGRFDLDNIGASLARAFIGLVVLAISITALILFIYYIFEYITIHVYWCKKYDKMEHSKDWLDTRINRPKFDLLMENYREAYKESNILGKIVLRLKLRKFYDVMCTEESKAKRTVKFANKLEKYIDRHKKRG